MVHVLSDDAYKALDPASIKAQDERFTKPYPGSTPEAHLRWTRVIHPTPSARARGWSTFEMCERSFAQVDGRTKMVGP